MMDVDNTIKGWQEFKKNLKPIRLVKRKRKFILGSKQGSGVAQVAPDVLSSVEVEYDSESSCTVTSGVIFEVNDNDPSSKLNRAFGLGLVDVPDAIWELIPFSFVVDYFINVQDWINSMNVRPEITVLGSWTSVKDSLIYKSSVVRGPHGPIGPSGQTVYFESGDCGFSIEIVDAFNRSSNPPLPLLPKFQVMDLGATRITTMCALIIARLNGGTSRT